MSYFSSSASARSSAAVRAAVKWSLSWLIPQKPRPASNVRPMTATTIAA